jgi:hypothetical protein
MIEDKIEELKLKIAQAENANEDLLIAESIMPKDTYYWIDYEVNVNWAVKSMDEVKAVLKAFAQKGIMLDRFLESEVDPIWKLKGKNTIIRLSPEWAREGAEGATCRLVKVGEEMIKQNKYKLVCDDVSVAA